ncbi:MAG: 16S rRNA (adenine(1518)-N(6)/adenine(1519)-N(6))-dimethyltransferase RsmA [Gammaproteobacteria bacterium]
MARTPYPKKRFGQHFLHDPAALGRIVAAIGPETGDCIVEIGPGRGALTRPLLARLDRLHVIEIDRDLEAGLRALEPDPRRLVIHIGDALAFDFAALGSQRLRIVGNLPYNISTPLLFHLLRFSTRIADMHFTLQREIVARMAAPPGSRTYGRLSVMLQAECTIERLFDIGRGAFQPAPAVESAFVRLVPGRTPPLELEDPGCFERVVRSAFSRRRKTLRNALKGIAGADDFAAAGIDPGARPETIAPEGFAALANRLSRRPEEPAI